MKDLWTQTKHVIITWTVGSVQIESLLVFEEFSISSLSSIDYYY
jgi:hypothetical protein